MRGRDSARNLSVEKRPCPETAFLEGTEGLVLSLHDVDGLQRKKRAPGDSERVREVVRTQDNSAFSMVFHCFFSSKITILVLKSIDYIDF